MWLYDMATYAVFYPEFIIYVFDLSDNKIRHDTNRSCEDRNATQSTRCCPMLYDCKKIIR